MNNKLQIIASHLLMLDKLNKDALNAISYVLYTNEGDEDKISPTEKFMIDSIINKIKRGYGNLLQDTDIELDEAIHKAKVAEILKEVEEYNGDTGSSSQTSESEDPT
jgi:hypothetical protein